GRRPGGRHLPRPVSAAPLHPRLRPPPSQRRGARREAPGAAPERRRPHRPLPAGGARGPQAGRRGRPPGAGRPERAGRAHPRRPGLAPPRGDRRPPPGGPRRAGAGIRLEEGSGVKARDRLGDYSTDRRVWTLSAMAVAIGGIAAAVAWALVWLIAV